MTTLMTCSLPHICLKTKRFIVDYLRSYGETNAHLVLEGSRQQSLIFMYKSESCNREMLLQQGNSASIMFMKNEWNGHRNENLPTNSGV